MKEFTFDIQRFACKIGDTTYSSITDAIAAVPTDGTATTIELTSLCRETGISIAAGKNVTINFAGYTYIATGDLTISTGATVNFTGGTITGTRDLTNSGTFTVTDMTMSNITLTSQSNGTTSISGDTSIKIAAGSSSYTYKLGNLSIATGGNDGSGTLTVTTASDGTVTIAPTTSGSFTDKTANATYTRAITSGVTFSYDSSGTLSIGNFTDTTSSGGTHTNIFYIKDNSTNVTTTYTVVGNSLLQTNDSDDTVKIWSGDSITQTSTLTPTDLATDSNYKFATTISNATLEFDGTLPETPLTAGKDVIVVDAGDFTKTYGTLTKSGGICHLTKNSGDIALSSITISDGSTVEFSAGYAGVEITVDTATKFKTVDSTKFTVTSSNGYASLGGTQNINLTGGSVLTSASNQTVAASSYNVYDYSGGDNGIVIATDKVGDIQVGESFVVDGTTYTRKDYGLSITVDGTEKIYVGNYDEDSYKAGIAVDFSNLNDSNFTQFSKFIQPESGVLTVGGENSLPAVVSDKQPSSSSTAVKKFGEIQIDTSTNAYTLTETDGGDISAFATTGTGTAAIATISVAGGDTTIDKTLSDGRFIATKGGAIFTVTSVSGSTFTVNGTSSTPTVKDATEITLYAGSITTDSNIEQKVNLNGAQTITVDSCEMEIAYTSANTFTVKGTQGDVFTLDGKEYTLTGTDGMTFTVTATGITISDLGTVDNDAFSATDVNSGNTINYSVRGAGFIKEESGVYSIWTPVEHQHTLTSNTVTVDELTSSSNWKDAATVDSDTKAATLPTSTFGYLVGYDDFKNRYGTFKSSGSVYTIDTVDSTDKLSAVSVGSDVSVLSMGGALANVVIQSSNVTLSVTDAGSDGVYDVTLSGGVGGIATVSTGEKVSLISGALKADSNVPVTYDGNILTANDDAVLTINADSSDATISALEAGKNFNVGSNKYTQTSVVGLINENGNYLFGSKKDGIKLSDINDADRWGELIAAGELSITASTKNGLVVDDTGDPQTLYADYEAGKSLLSQSNGGEAWPTDTAITIDTTTVNFSKDFSNGKVTIHAAQSDAEFLVGDGTTFSVTDVSINAAASASITSYASIGNAHNITQTGGTIYITDAAQIVNTENGTVSSAAGVTVFVSGNKTSLGAIDVNESLAVDGTTYTREQIGFMDSDAKLLLNTAGLTKVPVDSLQSNDTDIWKKTNAVTNNVLTLPTSTAEDDWIIIDSNKTTVYGSLTSDADGVITVNRNDNSFAILAKTSKAQFTTDTAKFTVTDGEDGASITGTELITLTGGTVALDDKNQSIIGGSYTINASSLGTDNVITVNMSSGTAVIGALDAGEIFIVDGETYTLQENGRFERKSDGKVWNGATVNTEGGSINVASLQNASYWNYLAQITSGTDLTIDESKTSVVSSTGDAAFIHDKNSATVIYGTFTRTGTDSYRLSTDGKTLGADFETITVTKDAPQVTFTSAFKDKTIIADNTATINSTATSNFTLFYDGTVASVTGSNALTLQNGTLTTGETTQVITANSQTVQVQAGTVTVALKDSTVTVDSIDTANDSVIVNGTTYTLTDATGGGFKINIDSGMTTLSDVGNGDKFSIGNDNFYKTSAGFFKTDDNGTPYMWTNSSDFNGTDVASLTGTDATNWTAIVATVNDVLTINTDSTTSIVVDSVTEPTMIRGKLTKSGNAVTLETYASTDTKPTAITVDAATATITDAFNTIPITATNSAVITTDTGKTLTFSNASDTFSVNGTAYKMTGAGLTDTTNNKIWTAAGVTSYVLPDDSAWSTLLTLDSNENLDLTSQSAGDGSNVIVDSTSTTRYATLTYTESSNTYNFKKADGDIATIALGAGTATVTTDFATNVTAQNDAVVTVNGNTYKAASTITVAATATGSTLDTGTVTIAQDDTVTADATISVTDSSSITATASGGAWTSLGSLNDGDTFTIGNTNYKVYGTTALVTLDGDGNIAELYGTAISNGTIAYPLSGTFSDVVQLDSDGTLDLTTDLGITEAVVIENGKPSVKVATLTYGSSTGYTLATISGGSLSNFKGVKLGKNIPQFTTAIATTITASDTGATYTVNGNDFTAQSTLTIATDSGSDTTAFLTAGTVTIATGAEAVTARRTSGTVTKDETIAATNGTVTVAVANSTTTTIGAIDNADKFTVDSKEYLATSIGLAIEADSTLIKDAATSGSITTDNLTGAQAYVQTTDGVLTIDTSSDTALVVDITTPASAKIFGTLTKNGTNAYTLTTDDKTDGSDLSGIAVNGVTATIASAYASTPITAGDGTFTVTATGDFTINATTTPLTFTAVDLITLTEGSLAASKATPAISLKGNTVIVTNGTMTIGYHETSGKAQISGLNNDETFTIDGEEYTVTNGRLFHGEEPVESGFANGVFTIDDANLGKMIAVEDDGTLDLTGDLTSGITYNVYNSLTKPTSKFAELEISTSGTFTLTQSTDFAEGCISTVAIAAGKTLNVDFATTVAAEAPSSSSTSAVTTVNSVKYNATSALTIAATDGSATLTDGTITLDDTTYKTATSSADSKTLRATEGTLTAVAKDGTFTTVSDLQADDSFTYNGATYTQKALGLMNASNQIREDLTPESNVTLSTLATSDKWTEVLTPENGTLDITGVTADKAFVYSDDTCATKLATLTLADSAFTLKPASDTVEGIDTVAIAAGVALKVQFATQVDVAKPSGTSATTTVNSKEYTSATALTIDATASSSTLNEGTVTIANGDTVTATDNNALTVTAGDGITAVAEGGSFTTVKDLGAGDSFTWKGDTYTYSTQGLINGDGQICESLNGTTVDLDELDGSTFINFLAPNSSGVLTLADGLSGSITVFDDATSPTAKLATLTVGSDGSLTLAKGKDFTDGVIKTVALTEGKTLTVNFETQVTAPIGTVTVNGNDYVGTTKLTIDSDGTTSTLTQGTVTLAAGSSVTPTDNDTITATAGTLTVKAASGIVTISGIADEVTFTVGDNSYAMDADYFYKTDDNGDRLVYTGNVDIVNKGITLTELSGTDWGILLEVTDGALTVSSTMSDFTNGITGALVVEKPTGSEVTGAVYGILTKTDDTSFTLTKPDTATGTLTAITAADVKLVMDADFANAAFTVGSSTFSTIALKNGNNTFTADATGTAPTFTDNVASLTLSSGNVAGVANQTVTAGTRAITPTTVNGTMVIDSEEIGGLTAGDVFTVDDTTYKVLTISGTAQIFNATSPAIVTAGFTGGTLNFAGMAETQALAPTNGVTDLADMTGSNAIVLNSATTPTTQLGTVTLSGSAYTVDFTDAAQVKTPSTAPVTVNGATYNGSALTLDTTADSSTLNTGTITLDDTTYTSATADKTLTAQSGTFTATAQNGTFTTVSDLQADDSFTYDGTTYTQTDLGLMNAAGQIREDLTPDTTIDLADLSGDWTDLLEVDDGVFTIEADTLTETVPNARLVNTDHTKMYGKLTRTAEATYTLTEADEALTTLKVNGATVTLDPEFRTASIVANGTEISALTLGNTNLTYTLTATDTPTLSDNVAAFTLGQGSVIVNANQTVTTGDNVLTATAGSLTVNATTISDIGSGDTFTLNDKNYMLMDSAGLFNVTDSALVDDYADGSVPFGSSETQVVAPVNGVVQLADVTEAEAIVLSDKTTSATKLGNVTKADSVYTIDYAAQVKTPSTESVTVNGATYNGSALTLDTTADSSTLTQGTVTLDNTESVTTTTGNTVTDTEGDGLTVTASGSTVTLGDLNTDDIFTVDGTEYRLTDVALYRLVDGTEEIYNGTADILGTGTITVAQLAADVWGGVDTVDDDTIVIDDKTLANGDKTKLTNEDGSKIYGELSRDADGKYTLTKTDDTTDDPAGITVDGVTAAIGSDFASVPITTENADYSTTTFTATPTKGAETFTVDATGNSPALTDVKEVELIDGAIAAAANQPVTLDDGKVVTPTSGTMTINSDGVSDLAAGDKFTVTDDEASADYEVISGVGLFNATAKALVDDFTDTFNFTDTETQILAPNSSGQVDLSAMTGDDALVFNSDTAPTTKLGTVTKADDAYTVDFATPLKLSAGNFSVNGKDYTATSDVVIQSDGATSTLTQGTVSLAVDDTVTTTTSGTVIKAVATDETATDEESAADDVEAAEAAAGEVITVTVNADGTILIGALSAGDVFTVNGKQYKYAMAGLMNPDGNIWTGEDFTDSLTLTALETADNWTAVLEVTGGNLAIDTETLAADGEVILVDNETDPIVTYGALVKSSDGTEYTLATDDTSATLNAIAIDNTTVNIDGALANVPVTANENATFTVTPNKTKQTFTVDATTEAPALTDNVKAVTLTAGTITAAVKQPVTVEASTITPTTINGTMTIGMDSIGGLTAGDEFTFDSDTYKVISGVGLFNATDKTLVESYTGGTFTYTSDETQILTPNSSGQVELSKVTGTKALVFNSDTAPTTKLGTVTKADTDYTVDFATPVKMTAGSFSVNGKDYTATSDVILQSDGTTSTLTDGTVTIAVNGSVTPTGKDTVTATSGDGLIVNVKGSTVTISGMNDGDTFTVGDAAYKVTAAGPINGDNKIWTGTKDYTDGLTTIDLATAANWSEMLSAPDGDFTVKPSTLEEGESVVVVDSTKNPTKTYGMLTKDSDRYTLTKGDDDDTLSSITDSGTIIDVDNDLSKVPVTTVVSDGSEATFTVTPAGGTDYFTVDATGTVPYINNAGSIEVIKGKITAADGIPITAADGAQDVDISAGDGTHDIGNKTVKIDGMGTDEEGNKNTVDFGTDSNGNLNSISGLKKGATVTVDGHTYTAPFDDATLKFNDNDGWYFDGYELDEYTVTVDTSGNVSVDEGVQFSKVVASGKTLDTSGTVKFAANTAKTPITVINKGTKGLNISDHTGDKLAANLGMTDGVKFSGNGTEIESLSDVAGATFTLDRDQSLTGNDATIKGGADDTEVLVASRGKFLDIDKAATVSAPATTELLLGNATYNLNGVELTTGDSTEASLTSDGVTVNLAGNDPLTFKGMTVGTSGTATFDTSGNVSLTSGATADNANGNTLTISGTVGIDDKTVTVAEATKVTATANGLNVGDDTLTVTGDEDGYIINIASSAVIGLADIGSSAGVTVNGLDDATVATDKASSLTVDKTFSAPAEVTYTVADGKLVSVTNAASIGGDFANGFNVNGTNYTVKGGNATVESDGNIHTGAGTYTISGHTFTTSQPTTFTTNNASVTGAQLDGDGNFAVHQDETNFGVDKDTLTFSDNDNPVTVGTASGIVATANGVNGLIDGLTDATVYDVSTATINGTPISITGDVVNVPVTGGAIDTITRLDAGATVNTAPNLTLTATANGTFTFVDDSYNVNDTVDATFDFITDSNSRVININGLSGLLSGAVDSISVNGQPFASTSDDVTLATDGTNITAVLGLSSGDIIAGSLSQATMTLPEGSVTINGAPFTLAGDSNGVELSGDGTVISGLDKDATLTVGAADTYNINGKDFAATAGQAYTVNREGVYPINASIMPITETTNADDILALGASSIYIAPSVTGSQSISFDSGNNVALIDSADAPTSVKTGTGTDSVVARHGAQATVDVENGTPIIVVTNGKVTLDNYNDNADIQTFDYTDIPAAVMNNDIKFGDGTMTLGDAVISFGTSAASTGATFTDIIGATGDKQPVGFTHTNGGTLNTADSSDNFILKGNYAQSSSDTQKGNGSSIKAGSGNDTVLVGANDTVDAGAGANQIYITDPGLKGAGATIALTSGTNTVHNFNPGFTATSDAIKISDLAALEIGFGDSGLTMASGNAQLMFDGMAAPTVTVAATDDSLNPAAPYELKLTDGTTTYNAAIAQDGKDLAVVNGTTADVFIGADTTGLSFNEYTGAVAVNLSDNEGTLDGSAVQIYGVDKVALGSGNGTLIGAENTSNTLIAGTGNGSIWSDSGNDLMRGNTSTAKTGSTAFFFAGGDGHDTIDGFGFMASASDTSADELVILPDARVTAVNLSGNDVVIGFNDGTDDALTITNAKDTPFRVNGLITKVDDNIAFDGFTECYVGAGDKPTLTVGQGMGEVDIFLGDDEGTEYLGDIAVLDASAANGEMNFLAGSDTDNMIIGGTGENAIWGGDGFSNDTLVGGSGKNTFFFAAENGNDIIRNAHDGDVVDLTYLDADQFAAVEVTSDGVAIDLTDGSHLDVQSNAAVEYKLGDGNTYLVDHDAGEFNRKEN